MKGWLDKYNDGGPIQPNYNDYDVSASPDFQGDGYSNVGRNYSPAWGGQFAMGGYMPGTVGAMYARTGEIPNNGKYAKKTMASAQTGTKLTGTTIEEEPTKPEPIELEPEKEVPYVPEPEPEYEAPVEPPETKSEPYVSPTSTSREREREREREVHLLKLYGNPQSDYDVQQYMKLFFAANKNKIDAKTISSAKKDIAQYINSPEYAQRQANFPERYIGGSADSYQKKKFDAAITKAKREERLKNLNTVPVTLTDDKHSNFFVPDENRIVLNKTNLPSTVYHELSHASSRNIDFEPIDKRQLMLDQMFGVGRTFPDSDRVNTQYWDSIVSKKGKKPVSPGLNMAEQNKFVELAKPADDRTDDDHFSNTTDAQEFSGEQYGDLMGVRALLHKSGITKSFGEKLDKGKLDKALNNSKVKSDPIFKRFLFRYGPENVIELNNTIAANNSKQGMPTAQNGKEMKFYQDGLDFRPKSISKNGSVIKDDMGQWAHPGEITEIGSNQITMQGVPYPVLGISDTGDTQMMYPNQEYQYDGDSVTEYPMMQNGGWLDALTNAGEAVMDMGKSAVNYVGSLFEDPKPLPVKAAPVKPKLDEYDTMMDLGYGNNKISELKKQLDTGIDYSKDKNRIKLGTGRFTGANVSSRLIDDIAEAAQRSGMSVGKLLALAARESTFGEEKGNTRHGFGTDAYTSAWNVADEYKPYDPYRFLADRKAPGINVIKSTHGYKYEVTDEKALRKYLKSNPDVINLYKNKLAKTPSVGNKNYFDLSAEFLKKKGVQGYNPGDPNYEKMFNQDYTTLKKDKALMDYLKKKKYTFEDGGQLKKLDQLTNFTNYNPTQPSGWLEKYQ